MGPSEAIFSQLGTAGAVIAATIILLREIRKGNEAPSKRGDTMRPPSNGRIQALEDKHDTKIERLDMKIQSQSAQLDSLTKEQAEVRAIVEKQGGKLDTIIRIMRRQ